MDNLFWRDALAKQVSENGSAKPRAKSVEFTRRTVWPYAGQEGLLFWTIVAMTGFRTHPEHTPAGSRAHARHFCWHRRWEAAPPRKGYHATDNDSPHAGAGGMHGPARVRGHGAAKRPALCAAGPEAAAEQL